MPFLPALAALLTDQHVKTPPLSYSKCADQLLYAWRWHFITYFHYGFSPPVRFEKIVLDFLTPNELTRQKSTIKTTLIKIKFLLLHINRRRVQRASRPHTLALQRSCSQLLSVGGRKCWPDKELTEGEYSVKPLRQPSLSHLCVFSIFGWNSLLVMLMIEVAATTFLPETSAHTHTCKDSCYFLWLRACVHLLLDRTVYLPVVMSQLLSSLLFFCLPLPLPL